MYLSHLDADRASAYPTLKTKGISENYIKASGSRLYNFPDSVGLWSFRSFN